MGRPLVYAHRGGAALRPENTIAAFDHGLSFGVDGLELDVHLSRDGVVVVHHDETLERTTNGRGPVASRTASELAQLDAGYHFSPEGGPVTADFPFRGRGIGVPCLPRGARALSAGAADHRVEEQRSVAGEKGNRRDPRGQSDRSRRARRIRRAGAARGPRVRAGNQDGGRARRDALGALRLLGRPAAPAACVSGVPGARARRRHHRGDAALRVARAPRERRREGLDRGRGGRHPPAARVGRRRHHHAIGPTSPCLSSAASRRHALSPRR